MHVFSKLYVKTFEHSYQKELEPKTKTWKEFQKKLEFQVQRRSFSPAGPKLKSTNWKHNVHENEMCLYIFL